MKIRRNSILRSLSTIKNLRIKISTLFSFSEYASVGYTAKRVQMRKNRFLAIQKMAKIKTEGEHIGSNNVQQNPNATPHHPKQMVGILRVTIFNKIKISKNNFLIQFYDSMVVTFEGQCFWIFCLLLIAVLSLFT